MSTEEQRKAWREHMAAYRAAHPDVIKAGKAAYYERHRDEIKAKVKAYRDANIEAVRARKKAARDANPEPDRARSSAHYYAHRDERLAKQRNDPKRKAYVREYQSRPRPRARAFCWHSNRRAEMYALTGRLTIDAVLSIAGPCAYCGGHAGGWDHVIPMVAGGANDISNLVPACYTCNRRKGRRDPRKDN